MSDKTEVVCLNCKHADWQRTEAGRLHPGGMGRCKYPLEMTILPAAFYWIGQAPKPWGGWISRKKEKGPTECPCFEQNTKEELT